MAETKFMKTVTYGGYDKADVLKRLENLNLQIATLKAEAAEAKLLLEEYKKGSDVETAYENTIANERAQLAQAQADNESLKSMLENSEADNKNKDTEIETLKRTVSELGQHLADANTKIDALQSGDDASALSMVFIEAQKSANALKDGAKKEAEDIENKAKALAENIITEANNDAAKIVYDAEKSAAITTADALNKSEEMSVASNNLKVEMLSDIENLTSEVSNIKALLESFAKEGLEKVNIAEDLLTNTEKTLKLNGVPKFKYPKSHEPNLPAEPKLAKVNEIKNESEPDEKKKKQNSGLDKLQQMAESIDGGHGNGNNNKKGGINLSELTKQANALDGGHNNKKGGINLAELARQANSIGGKK